MSFSKKIIVSMILMLGSLFLTTGTKASELESSVSMKSFGLNEIEPPYHPIYPLDEVKPRDINYPKSSGPLSINYVSTISFSKHQATGKDSVFDSKLDQINVNEKEEEVPNYIQISDHRGSNTGWELHVKQSTPFKNGVHSLDGTELYLNDVNLASLSEDESAIPEVINNETRIIPNDDYITLIEAKENQGMGTWLIRFGEDNEKALKGVQLFVPGKTEKIKGDYRTKLSWQLTDTPKK